MRYLLSVLFLLSLSGLSCKKTGTVSRSLAGTYTGTFERLDSTGRGATSNVTLSFTDSNWTGKSQFSRYPALCRGTYQLIGQDSIHFQNSCAWTADFDWSLILYDLYRLQITDTSLIITKNHSRNGQDIYKLTKL